MNSARLDFEEWLEELGIDAGSRGLGKTLATVPEAVLRRLWQRGAPPTITGITTAYLSSRKSAHNPHAIGG